ncbi:MAG: cytochrome ubiquinol oxidase subunit I [Tannerella sp.]|jgi:cytochrome d ubiquinol oxidase subunit I|nr:cytochrome ubiquinol oxidase subunit I [Tannerella sp.]
MVENIDSSLIDWSRAQFALTAIYHWIFVPLTLGLGVIMAVMETIYLRTGDEFWKNTAKFWMKLFGINFAIGVATGLILEFEFGTNWSNYSWFVGDIFGAPLAIEGIVAFFMEATFIAIMFFGWNKVSKRVHLTATWLTVLGATFSAVWILVANAWMQYPVGMQFNPDTVRSEMFDFWAVALSPMAINKFFHTVLSAWVLGGVFVVGISSWFLLKKRQTKFALTSIKIGSITGLIASLLLVWTGDGSAYCVARYQPMKLAAMEGLYKGSEGVGLVAIGVLNPAKKSYNDAVDPFLFKLEFPKLLSYLTDRNLNAYVPGIADLLDGGYRTGSGTAMSANEKIARGKVAIGALAGYRQAVKEKDNEAAIMHKATLEENFKYFGYGYIKDPSQLIPSVPLTFYSFRIMVLLGAYFILMFVVVLLFNKKDKYLKSKWLQWTCLLSIPLAYLAGQAGWVVAEVGRQPWAIQDLLPTHVAVSKLSASSVQFTFFLFLILFSVLLFAEIRIMVKAIQKGPDLPDDNTQLTIDNESIINNN